MAKFKAIGKTLEARHFNAIAGALNICARHSAQLNGEGMRLKMATVLADLFESNEMFDRTKFLLACGVAKRGDVTATVNPAKVATPANDNKGA